MHELTTFPSSSTVQLPQSPVPQPSFVPISPRSTRKASSRRVRGVISIVSVWSFTVKFNVCFFIAWIIRLAISPCYGRYRYLNDRRLVGLFPPRLR